MLTKDRPTHRLLYLDALRGIAALAVALAHALQVATGDHTSLLPFALGRFGVVVFFLISGYLVGSLVVRVSLEAFWIRRILRLYPLYWASIAGVLLAASFGFIHPQMVFFTVPTPALLLANLTMIQEIFGKRHMQSVYWTLTLELLFCAMASVLVSVRSYNPPRIIASFGLGVVVMIGFGRDALPLALVATMWAGAALAHAEREGASLRWTTAAAAVALGSLVLVGVVGGPINRTEAGAGALAYAGAALLWFWRPSGVLVRIGTWLGRLSYGMYLFHGLAILVLPPIGGVALTVVCWLVVTVVVSEFGERWIEHPGIALGRWLTRQQPFPAAAVVSDRDVRAVLP